MTDLGTLGGSYSSAYAINNLGQVVGQSELQGGVVSRAFVYANGVMSNLGSLGGRYSYATGINDSGQVVGTSAVPDDVLPRAFVHSGGVMHDLNTLVVAPAWLLLRAEGINNSGRIVANAHSETLGAMHTLLLTPTSAPADTTPPVIHSLIASPNTLGLPNGQMVNVTVTANTSDNADPAPVSTIVSVASNQLIAPGTDYVMTGPLTLTLRCVSNGPPPGRFYLITVECRDRAGNVSSGTVVVTAAPLPMRPRAG